MPNECKRYGCRKSAARVFCSAECRVAHHSSARPNKEQQPKACEQCGTEFTPTRAHQKTCSGSCRVALHRATKMVRVKVKLKPRPSTGLNMNEVLKKRKSS